MEAAATYQQGKERRSREVAALEGRARAIGTMRLVVVALAIGLVCGMVWGHWGRWATGAIAGLALAFVVLVVVHARVLDAKERAAAALRFHTRGLARMAHAWDELSATSARFLVSDHPFARDLDVFGRGSLMQLVDATETTFGEERLAKLLSLEDPGVWPDDVAARQAAVRDLAGRPAFREALAAAGGVVSGDRVDPAKLIAWAEGNNTLPPGLRVLGWAVPAILVGLGVAVPVLGLSSTLLSVACVAALVIGLAASTPLASLLEGASSREEAISRWRAMIALIEAEPFEAPRLRALQGALSSSARGNDAGRVNASHGAAVAPRTTGERPLRRASEAIASLERIVGFLDARRNEVFRFFLGPLVQWDVHCAAALLAWRRSAGAHVRAWLDTLAEVEALASLGGFAFEHPDFAWPELAPEPVLEVRGLGHPLVPGDRRVDNDVSLPGAGHALVVTGSNMSGKSTLLRALGLGVVLAAAGAPVCARKARLGAARVATSMRVEDSLEEGVSHFYAELRRLKRVLDLALEASSGSSGSSRGRPPVLFLLDEILHGTNSRERVLGACAVVRELLARGALGAVSTHDLGITALGEELGGRVQNVHFEEQVSGEAMTFDYVLRPGIVQSSNALRLMKAVGIDVVDAR